MASTHGAGGGLGVRADPFRGDAQQRVSLRARDPLGGAGVGVCGLAHCREADGLGYTGTASGHAPVRSSRAGVPVWRIGSRPRSGTVDARGCAELRGLPPEQEPFMRLHERIEAIDYETVTPSELATVL